ncbi:MAG: DNA topoisomerase VI [Planctomycetota bacterium JB042]
MAARKKPTRKAAKKQAPRAKPSTKKTSARKAPKKSTPKKSTPKKKAAKKKAAAGRKGKAAKGAADRDLSERKDRETLKCIRDVAHEVHGRARRKAKPELKTPLRSLSNVEYDRKLGYFRIGRQRSTRTLTVNTVKTFAQTLKMMALSKEMIETDDFATKRDAYYVTKNWGEAKFDEQTESDAVMDDIEAMFSLHGVTREQLRFYPDEHGGAVAGALTVLDRDPITGEEIEIDCTRFGSGAYSIPSSVEHLSMRTDAEFVLAIETGGMFQRLAAHGFWREQNCILVSMGGVPTRATRRFVRILADQARIPVYAFVDCDPYGIANIYRTLKVGSGNAAHVNRFFCVPQTHFLGVTPQDIVDYDLPTHPLKPVDVKRAKDALKNDPFFTGHPEWKAAMELLLKLGRRAEQQAFAKYGLDAVMTRYLPEKLADPRRFLP